MSATEALQVLAVDHTIGVTNTVKRQSNSPYFLQKNCWQLYTYSVLRNGAHKRVAINQLVIGDIITLHAGDIVPATLRLLKARSLTVLEEHVTGSAAPAHKYTFASKSLLPKAEQKNMLFAESEVLQGIAVGLVVQVAQSTIASTAKQVKNLLTRKGIVVQTKDAKKKLQTVDCVIVDDLQQESEIMRLVQKLYLEKSITSIFFVSAAIAKLITKHLPENVMQDAASISASSGIAIYTNATDAQKAKIIAAYKRLNKTILYIHRGEVNNLYIKIADVNLVVSSTASQAAMYHADLVAPKISITTITSILHNNK